MRAGRMGYETEAAVRELRVLTNESCLFQPSPSSRILMTRSLDPGLEDWLPWISQSWLCKNLRVSGMTMAGLCPGESFRREHCKARVFPPITLGVLVYPLFFKGNSASA